MSIEQTNTVPELDFNTPAQRRLRQARMLKDKLAASGIAIGGISVILAVVMIFFYLLYEVAPLFRSASIEPWGGQQEVSYAVPGQGRTLYLAVEEQAEIGFRATDTGAMVFFDTTSGHVLKEEQLTLPEGIEISSFALLSEASQTFALGLSDGSVKVIKHNYKATYPNGKRVLNPELVYPLGEAPLQVAKGPIEHLTLNHDSDEWSLIALSQGQLTELSLAMNENFLTGEVEVEQSSRTLPTIGVKPTKLLMSPDQRWLMASLPQGKVAVMALGQEPEVTQLVEVSKAEDHQF